MDPSSPTPELRIAFVLHSLSVAGAELLVCAMLRRLRDRIDPIVCTLDEPGPLADAVRAEGVLTYCVQRRPGLDLNAANRLASHFRDHGIDVIHAHQYAPFFYSALAKARLACRPRLIFTEHGRHYPDVVSFKRRWLNRVLLRRAANAVTGVSRFSTTALADKDGFASSSLQVIENGIDLAPFAHLGSQQECRQRIGLDPTRTYLVHVGRFHPVKDHAVLISAFEQLAARRPDVDLLLVGDGSLRNSIEDRIRSIQLQHRVHMLGTRGDVPIVLRAADVFVSTSVSEAAPLTLLEAMAAGLPVVVTAVGGNPEIVENGVHGYLAPRGDAPAIAAAIERILDDPARGRLGEAGKKTVHDRYTLDRAVDRYWELYRTVLGR